MRVIHVVFGVWLAFAWVAVGGAQFEREDPIQLVPPHEEMRSRDPFAVPPPSSARTSDAERTPSMGPFMPAVGGRPSGTHHQRLLWHAGCGLGAAYGAVPAIRPFLLCDGDRRLSTHALLRLTVRHDFLAAAVGALGGVVRASRTRVEIAACGTAGGFLACATASAGTLRVTTLDAYGSSHEWRFTPTIGGAVGYAFDIASSLRMTALFGLDVSPDRPSLSVDYDVAYSVPLASPSLSIRLAWGHL